MNLNEECLLQFLTNEGATPSGRRSLQGHSLQAGEPMVIDLKRILRRDRFVSFPSAIVVRRPMSSGWE